MATGRWVAAGLAGVLVAAAPGAHAEIVPTTPPLLLAPAAAALPGAGEIVLPEPREDEALPQEPAPESPMDDGVSMPVPAPGNIRWPAVAPAPDAVEAGAGAGAGAGPLPGSGPDEGADETPIAGDPSAGPLERGLAAWRARHDPRSQAEAVRWFRTAAAAGDPRASMPYAYLQGIGLGVARDPGAARRTLQRASDAGFARADYLMSLLWATHRTPAADAREHDWRERAARRGDPVAQNAMGVHYQRAGDRSTAQLWYQRAATHGSAAAVDNLAALAGEATAEREAAAHREAAERGDADALYRQARRHHRGEDGAVDYGRALQLYRRAAAQGSEPAQRMLGLIQSRPTPAGGFDPAWMQQLASVDPGERADGANVRTGATRPPPPKLDDPLSGLAALEPAAGQDPSPDRSDP